MPHSSPATSYFTHASCPRYLHTAVLQHGSFPLATLQLSCSSEFDHLHAPLYYYMASLWISYFALMSMVFDIPTLYVCYTIPSSQYYQIYNRGLRKQIMIFNESPHLELTSFIPGYTSALYVKFISDSEHTPLVTKLIGLCVSQN